MVDIDIGSAQKAIATSIAYPMKIHTASTGAQAVQLGPWTLAVSCKYGTSDKASCGYSKSVDFTQLRTQLQTTLSSAETQASTFLTAFNPVKTWMAQSLPTISSEFALASTAVAAALNALKKNGSLTPAEKKAVTSSLDSLMSTLHTSSNALSNSVQGLATFALAQKKYGTAIDTVVGNITTTGQQVISSMGATIQSCPCGQAAGGLQLLSFVAQFTTASGQFQTIFTTLDSDTTAASDALSLLMGTVLNFVNAYTPIITQIKQTQDSQMGTVLQQFHLDVAAGQWSQLAEYAKNQLQSEAAAMHTALAQTAAASGTGAAVVDKAVAMIYGTAA